MEVDFATSSLQEVPDKEVQSLTGDKLWRSSFHLSLNMLRSPLLLVLEDESLESWSLRCPLAPIWLSKMIEIAADV